MGNVLRGSARFNTVDAKRAVAGALLAGFALAGCSSGEQSPTTPAPTQSSPEQTPTAAPSPSETTVQSGTVESVGPMSPADITFTDNFINGSARLQDKEMFKAARFGSYAYDVVGTKGVCITKTQAELNEKVRLAIIASHEQWKQEDPDYYIELFGDYPIATRYELPSKALLEAAVTDELCPKGNNDIVVSFDHEGVNMQVTAKELLPFTDGGITEARATFGGDPAIAQKEVERIEKIIAKTDVNDDGNVDSEDILSKYTIWIPLLETVKAKKEMLDIYGYQA